jgi:hypothetical protein
LVFLQVRDAVRIQIPGVIGTIGWIQAIEPFNIVWDASAIAVTQGDAHLKVIREAIAIGITGSGIDGFRKAWEGDAGADFFLVGEAIPIGIRVQRIELGRGDDNLIVVAEAISIAVRFFGVGLGGGDFVIVGEVVPIRVRVVGIGFEEVFGAVLEGVAIAIIGERIAAPGDFEGIVQAVAVGIGAVGIGAEGGLLLIGEGITIGIGRRRRGGLAVDLHVIALAVAIGIGQGGIERTGKSGGEFVAIRKAISITVRVLRVQGEAVFSEIGGTVVIAVRINGGATPRNLHTI